MLETLYRTNKIWVRVYGKVHKDLYFWLTDLWSAMMVATSLQLILSVIPLGVIVSLGKFENSFLANYNHYRLTNILQLLPQCRSHPTLVELQSVLGKNWSSHVLLRTPLLCDGGSSTAHHSSRRHLQAKAVLGHKTLKGFLHLLWCRMPIIALSPYWWLWPHSCYTIPQLSVTALH